MATQKIIQKETIEEKQQFNQMEEIKQEQEIKPLVVYYSNLKTHSGEIAHKLALGLHGDIYEIKTLHLVYSSTLYRDGYKKVTHIPIVFDNLDFTPYNPIYIVGETYGKHVIGPIRNWIQQNKNVLLDEKKEFVYCILGKKSKKTINDLKQMLGEPKEIIHVDTFQYPIDADTLVQPSLQPTKTKVSYSEKVHRFLHT